MPRLSFALMAVLSFAVAACALVAYGLFPMGAAVHPDMRASFGGNKLTVFAHVFGSAVALIAGPLQPSRDLKLTIVMDGLSIGGMGTSAGEGVFGCNPASMRVLEKIGFVREATLHRSVFKAGQLTDRVLCARLIDDPVPCP